jgi:3-phosphoshikimate 1-carboxyvinyltransferase
MRLRALPSRRLSGRVRPPGDKSISHRALILGALAAGDTVAEGLLEGEDVLATAAAMRRFGADVRRDGEAWRIAGRGAAGLAEPSAPLDFGNSGTGARLTMGAAAGFPILAVYVGDESLSRRPMGRILAPLELMGARTLARAGGLLPAAIQGADAPAAIDYASPKASAQVKSAVFLAGVQAEGDTIVREPAPSRDHTERMLKAFGATLETGQGADGRPFARLAGRARLEGARVVVPADPSSAAFAAAAAALLAESVVTLEGVCLNPLRTGFFEAARAMGAMIETENARAAGGEEIADLVVRAAPGLRGAAPPAERAAAMIDEFPILAVLAAFAEGETRLTGAEELRVKESDRIALTARGLRACGVEVEELADGLVIQGRGPGGVAGGALIETHGDHRIAMSFLVLGLAARAPVTVEDAEMIATSFPDFAGFMAGLGALIEPA